MKLSGASVRIDQDAKGLVCSSLPDRGLSRNRRILQSAIFKEAFSNGLHYVGKLMVLRLRSGKGADLRLGVVASKHTFRRSVDRSRVKRLLREAYRLNRFRFYGDYDVVIVARQYLLKASITDAEEELIRLADKAGILKKDE